MEEVKFNEILRRRINRGQGISSIEGLDLLPYYDTPLFVAYDRDTNPNFRTTTLAEETIANNQDKFPKVGDTFKLKGNLRISWSYDIKYNKHIDLIFFPEENPYLNYVYLYAKDFPKKISNEYHPRELLEMNPSYDINYDFVRKILSQAGLSKIQQERFFNVRFGSVFVPFEVEFEWYSFYYEKTWCDDEVCSNAVRDDLDYAKDNISKIVKNMVAYDNSLFFDYELDGKFAMCVGVIKDYNVLSYISNLQINKFSLRLEKDKPLKLAPLKTLPTNAFATTKTKVSRYSATYINDFIANVRNKPDTKEGKIIAHYPILSLQGHIKEGYSNPI